MSADRLREAAKVLRERAEAATPGPWAYGETWATVSSGSDSVFHGYYQGRCECCGEKVVDDAQVAIGDEDRTYIATMHPGVGLALADWLEAAAENAEFMQAVIDAGRGENPHATLSRTPADRIADLILGSAP